MVDFGDERCMACTAVDLRRWLAEIIGCELKAGASGEGGGEFTVDLGGQALTLRWRARPPRRIAGLALPELELRFLYPPEGAEAARAWIARFDRHTQRGGG